MYKGNKNEKIRQRIVELLTKRPDKNMIWTITVWIRNYLKKYFKIFIYSVVIFLEVLDRVEN